MFSTEDPPTLPLERRRHEKCLCLCSISDEKYCFGINPKCFNSPLCAVCMLLSVPQNGKKKKTERWTISWFKHIPRSPNPCASAELVTQIVTNYFVRNSAHKSEAKVKTLFGWSSLESTSKICFDIHRASLCLAVIPLCSKHWHFYNFWEVHVPRRWCRRTDCGKVNV